MYMTGVEKGLNQERIQNRNRSLLLRLLRREGLCSRAHLAKLSGLKQATVTNITSDLISWGVIKETGFLPGEKGRRSIGISIDRDTYRILGIRLARKDYSLGLFNLFGESIELNKTSISKDMPARAIFEEILEKARKLIEKEKNSKVIAIGMAVPGPYSEKNGHIEMMTGVFGWERIHLREELEEEFHLPVFIEQDANAGAVAQFWFSSSENEQEVLVYIADGQGVGAGIISKGELMKGSIGMAGEIGHTSINYHGPRCACGNYGCLENYCSSIAYTKEYNKTCGDNKEYTFAEVREKFMEGDELAKKLYLQCCDYLAVGIVNIINGFNPSAVIIGDEMSHLDPKLMLSRVKKKVAERVLPSIYSNVQIKRSVVKGDSVSYGAAIVAIKNVFDHPKYYFCKEPA